MNLAIATQAFFLVSRDKDLLDLLKENVYRETYPALTIIDPVALLEHVRTEVAQERGGE